MKTSVWDKIIKLACKYPSPHNSQPIKIKIINPDTAELYYDLDLGLPAENYGIPFAHVCAGVFLESLETVANGLGYSIVERLDSRDMDFASTDRLHLFATVELHLDPTLDHGRAAERLEAFERRQTSRRPYDNRLVDESAIRAAQKIASRMGHVFKTTSERRVVGEVVRVNQETLFDDLRNDPVYKEIMLWLRFSKREAAVKRDGLSAETMLIPGGVLRFGMSHRRLWEAPIIGSFINGCTFERCEA